MNWFLQSKSKVVVFSRAAFLILPLLAGCTYQSVGEVRKLDPSGDSFANALSHEYRQFALYEADDMADWIDAGLFAGKALDASQGHVRDPELIEDWDIEADKVTELNAARERLMMFLNAGGGDVTPIQTAKAQASFDCWLEQQEEKWQFDHIALCRDGFYAAIEEVEPVVKPRVTLMFEFGSDVMDEEQHANLELFARYMEKFDTGVVVVNGHADKAGAKPYNHSLSRARSIAVWRELIKAGVSPERVAISAYGETHPVIDTPDGMREPLNRRAEVELRLPPLYATINQTTDFASTSE